MYDPDHPGLYGWQRRGRPRRDCGHDRLGQSSVGDPVRDGVGGPDDHRSSRPRVRHSRNKRNARDAAEERAAREAAHAPAWLLNSARWAPIQTPDQSEPTEPAHFLRNRQERRAIERNQSRQRGPRCGVAGDDAVDQRIDSRQSLDVGLIPDVEGVSQTVVEDAALAAGSALPRSRQKSPSWR